LAIAFHVSHRHTHHHSAHHHVIYCLYHHIYFCHSHAGGNLILIYSFKFKFILLWISAFAEMTNLLHKKSRCGWQRLFAIYIFSELSNRARCGSSPHHHTHHIANYLVHFVVLLVTKIRAEFFNIQTQTSFLRKINFKACKMNNQELDCVKNDYYLIFD